MGEVGPCETWDGVGECPLPWAWPQWVAPSNVVGPQAVAMLVEEVIVDVAWQPCRGQSPGWSPPGVSSAHAAEWLDPVRLVGSLPARLMSQSTTTPPSGG